MGDKAPPKFSPYPFRGGHHEAVHLEGVHLSLHLVHLEVQVLLGHRVRDHLVLGAMDLLSHRVLVLLVRLEVLVLLEERVRLERAALVLLVAEMLLLPVGQVVAMSIFVSRRKRQGTLLACRSLLPPTSRRCSWTRW